MLVNFNTAVACCYFSIHATEAPFDPLCTAAAEKEEKLQKVADLKKLELQTLTLTPASN